MTNRIFSEKKLVIASHNPGKVGEIGELLAPFQVEVISAKDLALPVPVEDGETFIDNAKIKAIAAAAASNLPALADDSGLCVHGLNDQPGVYSARWSGPTNDFGVAMRKVEQALVAAQKNDDRSEIDRSAHFACALTLAWPDGYTKSFEGQVQGTMAWPPAGSKGFGYDPTFIPDGHSQTFAQMEPEQKHAMSHRAKAFKKLVAACFEDA